ncbi:MAG: hypothetical protein DIU62_003825 [Pseudomonadota bacterium]
MLMLGTLAISGYQEVDRRGVLASRQSAWMQEWSPGVADARASARELHQQLLSDPGVLDPHGRRLLVAEDDLGFTASRGAASGVSGTTAAAMLGPLRVVSGFLGSSFDVDSNSLIRGEVSVRIPPLEAMPAPFDSLELTLRQPFALLGDSWQAGGIEHVRRRSAGLVPTNLLREQRLLWEPLIVPLSILEPSLRRLCFGLIEPDRIPEDRLSAGRTPLPEGCP